jgi:hypothetical protein
MRFGQLSRFIESAAVLLAGVIGLAFPLCAQLQIGNNLNLRLNGTLSTGYNADYGNLTSSDHSIGVGGAGTVSGSYYNPNFLSFSATPYYGQARDSSGSLSLSNSSGVTSQAQLFSGSPFPASITFSKAYDSEGSFDVPGSANYTTHGNSDSLGLGWSEHLPGLPSFSAAFQKTGSQSSIYGSDQSATSSGHALNFNTSYTLAGFGLGSSYYLGGSSSEIPQFLAGGQQLTSTSATDHGYTFTASHRLPWNGSVFADYGSSTVDLTYLGTHANYTVGNFNSAASFQPTQKLGVSMGMTYSSNLSGSLVQTVLADGGVVSESSQSPASHSYAFTGGVGYAAATNLRVQGQVERRIQEYNGVSAGANDYSASASYWHYLFGGRINSALTVQDATIDGSSQNSLGFNATTTFNRRFGKWGVDAAVNYAQNVQTLLVTYTTSQYGYGGSLKRKWGIVNWSLSTGVGSSGLTGQSGTTSQSKSVSTGLGIGHWANMGASYSESSGNGILTGGGITSTPVPTPILPATSVLLYGGKSYSYSIGSTPIHRLTLSASYAHSESDTGNSLGGSINTTKIFTTLIQYQFRKMYLTSGFSQLTQGFTASGTVPQTVSSFYLGISRWFNFF